MQKSTLLVLLILVAALGVGVWWSENRVVAFEEALFPGIAGTDVVSVRVDNVERDLQIRIDRNENGGWDIVDPIVAVADEVLMASLMEIVDRDRLRLVPGDPSPQILGFEPARIVFQVETRSGEKRSAEVGVVDVAHNTVHIRVRNQIFRGPLRIDTELTRDLPNYRRPYAFSVTVEQVGEIHRVGESLGGQHRFGYELHAILGNDGWQLVSPFAAGLHPGPMSLFITNTIRIPVRTFLSENADSRTFGLDPPRTTMEFVELGGAVHKLGLGAGGVNSNHVASALPAGDPFLTDTDSVRRLEIPIELLLDRRVMRAPRELIENIELERMELPSLFLSRSEDSWMVAEGAAGKKVAADPRRLEQFLGSLETSLFYDMLEVGELDEQELRAKLRFRGGGEEWELRIGGEHDDEGTACFRVQRRGDGIIGLLSRADSEFLSTRFDELRDHRLTNIDELTVSGLVLNANGESRKWNRDSKGKWTREGRDSEAFEILSLLDPLLHLRAEKFAPNNAEDVNSVVVEVLYSDGNSEQLSFGKVEEDGESRAVMSLSGESALESPESRGELAFLAEDLQGLLGRIEAVLTME